MIQKEVQPKLNTFIDLLYRCLLAERSFCQALQDAELTVVYLPSWQREGKVS